MKDATTPPRNTMRLRDVPMGGVFRFVDHNRDKIWIRTDLHPDRIGSIVATCGLTGMASTPSGDEVEILEDAEIRGRWR